MLANPISGVFVKFDNIDFLGGFDGPGGIGCLFLLISSFNFLISSFNFLILSFDFLISSLY